MRLLQIQDNDTSMVAGTLVLILYTWSMVGSRQDESQSDVLVLVITVYIRLWLE